MTVHKIKAFDLNNLSKGSLKRELADDWGDTVFEHVKNDTQPEFWGKVKGLNIYRTGNRQYSSFFIFRPSEVIPCGCVGVEEYETSLAVLTKSTQGQGIMFQFYSDLIKKKIVKSSSADLSPGSLLLWKKICDSMGGGFVWWKSKKTCAKIADWKKVGKYVLPMVMDPQGNLRNPIKLEQLQRRSGEYGWECVITPGKYPPPNARLVGL